MSGPGAPRLLATALLLAAALAVGCSPGSSPRVDDVELARHLRLARDQMRQFLPESARAELERSAEIAPDHPEVLFQTARLELMADAPDVARARELLEQVAELEPESVKTHSLLYELARQSGDGAAVATHRAAVERLYGRIGELEMVALDPYPARPAPSALPEATSQFPEYQRFRTAIGQLRRRGNYAPTEAVPVLEEVFEDYPDLSILRLWYANVLANGEVRVNFSDRDDRPPMSSSLVLDYAQSHLERVFDQVDPRSAAALDAIRFMENVALSMADYDQQRVYADILLTDARIEDAERRRLIGRKGLASYKEGRYDEAIRLLLESLAGLRQQSEDSLSHLWLLHLSYEASGTPAAERRTDFVFRPDLARTDPGIPLAFVDVAPSYGVDKLDGVGPSAWGDYDQDGDDDLYVSGADSYGALYRNDGERFTDVSEEAGLLRVQSGFSSTFVDYDNDGWLDLYIGRDGWNGPAPNSLFRNRGDGTFVDVTTRAGVGDAGSSFVHAWSDVDRDGFVDLYVANGITGGGDVNALYHNNGDGTFSDWTEQVGLLEPPGTSTIGLAFGDYDDDGWPDLFVTGYLGRNRLFHNRGDGTFEERAEAAGVAGDPDAGYVAFFFDYDNDGDLDILRTMLAPWHEVLLALSNQFSRVPAQFQAVMQRHSPKLYRNDGNGSFTEVGRSAGLVHPIGVMGANIADLDNDGYTDLYFGTGNPSVARLEPDRFYRNLGDGTFVDLTFAVGLGNLGKGHGITTVDIDGDGDLELYAPEGGFVHGDLWANAFYLNNQATRNHWLHIDLQGVESNRDAIDTVVRVTAGHLTLRRTVRRGAGFGSTSSPTLEFGLGAISRIDHLEIRWPSGLVQTFNDAPIDARIVLEEGQNWRKRSAIRADRDEADSSP